MKSKFVLESATISGFKQVRHCQVSLKTGVVLVAGRNNAGKSTLLQALAIWEFCKLATLMERDRKHLSASGKVEQGFGIDTQDFTPINLPSAKHLWTNLKPGETSNLGGYNIRIGLRWNGDRFLEFGLSLTNNRIFIKTTETNLDEKEDLPTLAYVPTYSGMLDRERRVGQAERKRLIGQGAVSQVLRNMILDMYQDNFELRAQRKGTKKKLSAGDLRFIRTNDPFEILQRNLRQNFSAELKVHDFLDEYHQFIGIEVVKGEVDEAANALTKYPNFTPRDLMVEGAGFLQWVGIYTFLLNDDIDVLLLDEPDAHLHPTKQKRLLLELIELSAQTGKQILVATHSPAILEAADPSQIIQARQNKFKYLVEQSQLVDLIGFLGAEFDPIANGLNQGKSLIICEGVNDKLLLERIFTLYGENLYKHFEVLLSRKGHSERKTVFDFQIETKRFTNDLKCISLRDRDEQPANNVMPNLRMGGAKAIGNFLSLTWRLRHIENYLLSPSLIMKGLLAKSSGSVSLPLEGQSDSASHFGREEVTPEFIAGQLKQEGMYIEPSYCFQIVDGGGSGDGDYPGALVNVEAKRILSDRFNLGAADLIPHLEIDSIPTDFSVLYDEIMKFIGEK